MLPALLEPIPASLEASILSKAEAAMPKPDVAAAPAPGASSGGGGGAKVFRFLAGPQLAIAASLVLVAGAAALYAGATRMSKRAESVAQAPAPAAADNDRSAASVAATTTAAAPAQVAAPEPMPMSSGAAAAGVVATSEAAKDPAFAQAKAAFDDGRYAEACPQLDALAKANPEADFYAARCISHNRGCLAAVPRFDSNARRNPGTETGSRAALESARCFRSIGDSRAIARYAALKNDTYVGDEAQSDIAPAQVAAKAATAPPPATPAATAAAPAKGSPARPLARPTAATKPAANADSAQ